MEHQDWKTVSITSTKRKENKIYSGQERLHAAIDNETGDTMKKKSKGKWGKKIIKIRMQKKMNQKDFSKLLNVKQALLTDWEKNISDPPNYIQNKILTMNIK